MWMHATPAMLYAMGMLSDLRCAAQQHACLPVLACGTGSGKQGCWLRKHQGAAGGVNLPDTPAPTPAVLCCVLPCSRKRVAYTIAMDIIMIVTALPGELVPGAAAQGEVGGSCQVPLRCAALCCPHVFACTRVGGTQFGALRGSSLGTGQGLGPCPSQGAARPAVLLGADGCKGRAGAARGPVLTHVPGPALSTHHPINHHPAPHPCTHTHAPLHHPPTHTPRTAPAGWHRWIWNFLSWAASPYVFYHLWIMYSAAIRESA